MKTIYQLYQAILWSHPLLSDNGQPDSVLPSTGALIENYLCDVSLQEQVGFLTTDKLERLHVVPLLFTNAFVMTPSQMF